MASKDLTPAPGEIAALLGRGTEFRGKLVFEGRVRLDGRFEGEVHGDGVLVVGDGAELDGTFDVGSLLVLGGVVRGRVRARELVELHADAHVAADLETPRLFVDKGARFDGQCRMGDGSASERFPLDEGVAPVSPKPREVEPSSDPVSVAETKSIGATEDDAASGSSRAAAANAAAEEDAPAADALAADAPAADAADAPAADAPAADALAADALAADALAADAPAADAPPR